VISPKPVSGQYDKRMLLGALCPVQTGCDMATLKKDRKLLGKKDLHRSTFHARS